MEKTLKWLNNPKNFFVYCGNSGLGKTHFSASVFEYMMLKVNSIRYWNEADLFQKIRESISDSRNHGDYIKELKILCDSEFLILDDIGSTGINEWRKEIMFKVIDLRYEMMTPTVISSNFDMHQIRTMYGERFYSRLASKENTIMEIMNGPDWRQAEK